MDETKVYNRLLKILTSLISYKSEAHNFNDKSSPPVNNRSFVLSQWTDFTPLEWAFLIYFYNPESISTTTIFPFYIPDSWSTTIIFPFYNPA